MRTARFLDREVVLWDLEEAAGWALRRLEEGGPAAILTLNPETWLATRGWEAPSWAVWSPESLMVAWGLRRHGLEPARVPGADLVERLLGESVEVVCWGGDETTARELEGRWSDADRSATLVASFDGYGDHAAAVARACAGRRALLLVGQGAGRQERTIANTMGALEGGVAIGVGGTLDVLAGRRLRAPRFVRSLGLEAPWRVGLSLARWRRLFKSHPAFVRAVRRGP